MSIKKCLALCGVIILVASVFGTAIGTGVSVKEDSLSEGSVAEEDAVKIEDWHDLDEIRDDLEGDYVLMNDLEEDTEGYTWHNRPNITTHPGWEPIGGHRWQQDFTGSFDGQGYQIRNLRINRSDEDHIGLFGVSNGELKNINLVNANVSGESDVGGLVGRTRGGCKISNSSVTGAIRGKEDVGGLVGSYDGTLSNSYVSVKINGEINIGALIGRNWGGIIENSHYNIEECLINGGHHVTSGGIFNEQYEDWIEDKNLDIEDYDSLESAGEYYEIRDVQGIRDLLGFAWNDEYKFRLVEDIDLSDEQSLHIPYFAADFHGNGSLISNLKLDLPFLSNIGFIGFNNGGSIIDFEITDGSVHGYTRVGGLIGRNGGTISNSHVSGDIMGDNDWFVGGLIGRNLGRVSESSAKGNVTAEGTVGGLSKLGGLAGSNSWGTIENSCASVNVKGAGNVLGGLVGLNIGIVSNSCATGNVSGGISIGGLVGVNRYATVANSYATGNVSGEVNVGGLVGRNRGTVSNSYATGNVSGRRYDIGGLVGRNEGGTVENSFWDIETSGRDESDGGTGKTTAQMKDVATYTDTETDGLEEPWDFVGDPYDDEGDEDIWDIDEDGEINDGYPFLTWEEVEDEEDNDDIPGFTSMILLLGIVFAVAIYQKKKEQW